MHCVILWFNAATWRKAPFNGGEGGTFGPIYDDLEYMELVAEELDRALDEAGIDRDASPYVIADDDRGSFGRFQALTLADGARNAGGTVTLKQGDSSVQISTGNNTWGERLKSHHGDAIRLVTIAGITSAVWIADGGRSAWDSAQETRDAELAIRLKDKGTELARKSAHNAGNQFVNPYTFVPLPEGVDRAAPRGHASMGGDGLCGWFDWELAFVTPLVLPKREANDTGFTPALLEDGILNYPGSSLRGVLRSLHETLAGGCLRIVDADYVPIHREPMSAYKPATYRLAIVSELDPVTHAVTKVRMTKSVQWVRLDVLGGVFAPRELRSGARATVDVGSSSDRHGRHEVTEPGTVKPGGDWVIHLTHAGARRPGHPYFAAFGELGDDESNDLTAQVSPAQWARFVAASEGSQDLIGDNAAAADTSAASPGGQGWPGAAVRFPRGGPTIGFRRKADGWLGLGDTVWISDGGELKMSAIWRRPGVGSVSSRLPASAAGRGVVGPCSDPDDLCPTCAVFGSIEAEQSERHEQKGYASHVRVGWGVSPIGVTSERVAIPPLRSPKPSSGGFYLIHSASADLSASDDENHVTRAHWGSSLDKPALRQIRGRKYYWHGQDGADPNGRHTARFHAANQCATVDIVHPLTLTARVYFDNLDEEQLGYLLAAAAPASTLGVPEVSCAVHVGAGKPLGFGSARPIVRDLVVQSARSRYGDGQCDVTVDSALAKIAAARDTRGLAHIWTAMAKALGLDSVAKDRIWYPPMGTFGSHKGDSHYEFDATFSWFASRSGGRVVKKNHFTQGDLVVLPQVAAPTQYLATGEPKEKRRG